MTETARALRTPIDLLAHAEFVSQGVPAADPCLWLTMLDPDDVPLPVLVPIDDIEGGEDDAFATALFDVVTHLLGPGGGSTTFLLERPGSRSITADDLAWDVVLRRAGRAVDIPVRGVFVAVQGVVRPVTADDAVPLDAAHLARRAGRTDA